MDIIKLQQYVDKAKKGDRFSPKEANDFRELSEQVACEYSSLPWTAELLKLSWIVFAADAVAPKLNALGARYVRF